MPKSGYHGAHSDSVFFHHVKAVGKGGRELFLKKFRTKKRGSKKDLPGGRVLRALHVDELPQLWNLLKRDLHLVGFRVLPEQLYSEMKNSSRPESKSIIGLYDEVGPAAVGIKYACKNFPPTEAELLDVYHAFHKDWKKSKNLATLKWLAKVVAGKLKGRAYKT